MVNREVKTKFTIDCFHTAFRFKYAPDFLFRGEAHDFWEVNYVMSGQILMTQDGKVYHMKAGDVIFHPPMAFHREQSAEGSTPEGYTFTFHTDGNMPCELCDGVFALTHSEREEFESLAERLIPYVNHNAGNEFEGQLLSSMLSVFCIRLASEHARVETIGSESASRYENAVMKMHEAIYENCTLSEIARRVNISVSYLKLLFYSYAGVSPKSYYISLRANEAAKMIREGIPISEISQRLSFASANYFSIFFKKFFGISPSKFK